MDPTTLPNYNKFNIPYTLPEDRLSTPDGEWHNLLWVEKTDRLDSNQDSLLNSLRGQVEQLQPPPHTNLEGALVVKTYMDDRAFALWATGHIIVWQPGSNEDPLEDDILYRNEEITDVSFPENCPLTVIIKDNKGLVLGIVLNTLGYEAYTGHPTPRKTPKAKRRLFDQAPKPPASSNQFWRGLAAGIGLCAILFGVAVSRGWITIPSKK